MEIDERLPDYLGWILNEQLALFGTAGCAAVLSSLYIHVMSRTPVVTRQTTKRTDPNLKQRCLSFINRRPPKTSPSGWKKMLAECGFCVRPPLLGHEVHFLDTKSLLRYKIQKYNSSTSGFIFLCVNKQINNIFGKPLKMHLDWSGFVNLITDSGELRCLGRIAGDARSTCAVSSSRFQLPGQRGQRTSTLRRTSR